MIIKKIKPALAADKKRSGGFYNDGQGLRYAPPRLYIQLNDFTAGLRYMNWFEKNFPEDCGYTEFLFEWAIILFKRGRIKEAEKKVFQTFTSNIYVLHTFFGDPIYKIEKLKRLDIEDSEYPIKHFSYSSTQENIIDFAAKLFSFANIYNENIQ